jgi:hypothetical protein
MATYEFMLVTREIASAIVVSPNPTPGHLMLGLAQKVLIVPPPVFQRMGDGSACPSAIMDMLHAVPGTSTADGVFPDDTKPQMRTNVVVAAAATYEPMYHGEPGVLRGDDNWSPENPSIQAQMRLNTLPHTDDPPAAVVGTWRVNEVFLPQ